MQIQLKQVEIIAALRQYVEAKGISLAGKTVDIAFTAGRKEGGLTADISIEDHDIPGLAVGDVEENAVPGLVLVTKASEPVPEVTAVEAAPAAEVAGEAPKATSLFS